MLVLCICRLIYQIFVEILPFIERLGSKKQPLMAQIRAPLRHFFSQHRVLAGSAYPSMLLLLGVP